VADVAVARLEELAPGDLKQVEVNGVAVLLARVGDEVSAVGAHCVHYGAPLVEGVLHGRRLVCPWHHAVYDALTGHHEEPPGCDNLQCYPVRIVDGEIRVAVPDGASGRAERDFAKPATAEDRRLFAIVGAGAAGQSAAETLRGTGYRGRILLVSREQRLPYDRTLLSKEVLRGAELPAPLELRPRQFYKRHGIELWLNRVVTRVAAAERRIDFADGGRLSYDACLVATGGRPRRLDVPGANLDGILTLRTRRDVERILSEVESEPRVVVVGGSFIALECAASLTSRNLPVTVVARHEVPFARLFGEEIGRALMATHVAKGTRFLAGQRVERFDGRLKVEAVVMDGGERIPADLVILGVGVEPVTDFLEGVACDEDGGIPVDERMQAAEHLFAAGDIASVPLPPDGRRTRIEHWRVACEHGRIAALNMLGRDVPYRGVPFFWSAQHWALYYTGHAGRFDEVILDGRPGECPFVAYYAEKGRIGAALGVQRNAEMAAIQELMRLGRMPTLEELRRAPFDAVRHLRAQDQAETDGRSWTRVAAT
jgi:NADPH-dependent 2,4-dienoyl-CoA reductase/sulfur reductase-like enzyme/nitrite reductase/ring-hydroxylating ferredoxin subunit